MILKTLCVISFDTMVVAVVEVMIVSMVITAVKPIDWRLNTLLKPIITKFVVQIHNHRKFIFKILSRLNFKFNVMSQI